MAAPSHAMDAPHMWHWRYKKGYEWWVSLNWKNYIEPQLARIFDDPNMKNVPEMGEMWVETAFMGLMTKGGGYAYDRDEWTGSGVPTEPINRTPQSIVGPIDSFYNALMLIPQAIKAGGHLFKGFWRDIGMGGVIQPAICHAGGDHADDNFDVSTRLLRLEELDPTKQLWKDLYGRTGAKKGYTELLTSKNLASLYRNAELSATDEEFNANYGNFLYELKKAKAQRHSFEEAYLGSADVAILSQGFPDEAANLLVKKLKEPIREVMESFNPSIVISQSLLVIPSG